MAFHFSYWGRRSWSAIKDHIETWNTPKRKGRILQKYVWHLCADFVKNWNWFIIFKYDLSENAALLIYNLVGLCFVLMLYIFHRYVLLFSRIKETSILNLPSPLLFRRGDIIDLHLSVGQLISSFVDQATSVYLFAFITTFKVITYCVYGHRYITKYCMY